jgi:electron transfer flavoprotein beta subunit
VGDGDVTARRESDAGFEVYRLALPAVVGVKEGINLPRYPTLPGRLKSKKAEIVTVDADATPGGLTMVKFETPVVELTETEILDANAVVDLLYELGLA